MKGIITVVFAATMFATVSAKANDNWAEERYKAKMGRYTPAEEARRASASRKADSEAQECAEHSCCRRASGSHSGSTVGSNHTMELLRAKLGRDFAVQPLPHESQHREIVTGGKPSFSEEWRRAKLGWTPSTTEDKKGDGANAKVSVVALSCCD